MILKIINNFGDYTLYDDIKSIQYKTITRRAVQKMQDDGIKSGTLTFLFGELHGSDTQQYVYALTEYRNGDKQQFIITNYAYLLNDNGKTVEKLYREEAYYDLDNDNNIICIPS